VKCVSYERFTCPLCFISCSICVLALFRYEWIKDGRKLDVDTPPDGVVYRYRAGTGTIIVDPATAAALEGSYQCVAGNQFGAAVTDLAIVRMAGLPQIVTFPSILLARNSLERIVALLL